jgi:hypothetical protein
MFDEGPRISLLLDSSGPGDASLSYGDDGEGALMWARDQTLALFPFGLLFTPRIHPGMIFTLRL